MILCGLVSRIRQDYMIMTHSIPLTRAAGSAAACSAGRFFRHAKRRWRTNIRSRAEARRLLGSAAAWLIVLPRRRGSPNPATFHGPAEELEWGSLAAKLILRQRRRCAACLLQRAEQPHLSGRPPSCHQTLKLSPAVP